MSKLVELTQEQIAANDRLLAEREAAHMRAKDAYNRGEAVPLGGAMVKWPKYFYPLILMKIGGWIEYD
jgi:sugar phosphate isomerase/epimerase